jgi:two-component system phosphate regulon sensor histidine kinase PhoR
MKLWLKISLIALIMVTLATGLCSLVMLLRAGQSSLNTAVKGALSSQKICAASWSDAMSSEISGGGYGAVAKRSLAKYLIDRFADESTILASGGDFIYNATNFEPQDYLPLSGENRQYVVEEIGSASMLIVGSRLTIEDTDYQLYTITDISGVYTGIETLSWQFTLINLAVIAVAGVLIVLLVRLVLWPMAALKNEAAAIASGVYDGRVSAAERDEVGELAADFNRMAEAVQSRVQALCDEADRRTLFMSALTHELKTPMTSISGNAQTLLRTRMDEEEREDALLRIDAECTRVERLSQKMMQLIVLNQRESIQLEPGSVSELLEEVRLSSAEQVRQRGLALTIACDMDTLTMDADLLVSLLLNLIDNAGKASTPGGAIEISASDNAISVIDHGRGIPPGEIGKITQPFYMVDKSRSRKAGGIGLGLALAEEIARLHGARLEFESEPGRGTTAKVVFTHAEE